MTESPDVASIEQLSRCARSGVKYAEMTDRYLDMLEDRIIAVEEIIAAPWPRSWLLLRRLRRRLRASVAGYGWPGATWRGRRSEAATDDIIVLAPEHAERPAASTGGGAFRCLRLPDQVQVTPRLGGARPRGQTVDDPQVRVAHLVPALTPLPPSGL